MARVWKFGDNVNTDQIIPGRYYPREDVEALGGFCLCELRPDFAAGKQKGDIIVAGKNFGCGSSREYAAIALRYSGMRCVIAQSFARIFYRNCINVGFPILICDLGVEDGDQIAVDLEKGVIRVNGKTYLAKPLPKFVLEIFEQGGIIEYIKAKGIESLGD
ncbi:MAG: 3-isopropylmalate dehydratase small subunit [Candidatus Woesearchaeota archaeon]